MTELERTIGRGARPGSALLVCLALVGLAPGRAGAALARPAPTETERMGRELGRHVLKTLDGGTLSIGALRGEVVVVNFWASWCGPCRKELPRLDALHASIAGSGGRVVAVSIDHEERNVRRFAKSLGLSLPLYHDGPDGLARKLDIPAVPFTVVLDRGGAVAFTASGAETRTLEAIAGATRRLMAARPGESASNTGETP